MNCAGLKCLKLPLTVAFAIAAFSAQAADIYSPAAPAYAVVALPPSWGGFYAGINGGYGGNSGLPFREDVFFPTLPSSAYVNSYSYIRGNDTIAGGFGGGQLGYNYQFGSFVLGAEADIQGAGITGSGSRSIFTNLDGLTNGNGSFCQANAANLSGVADGVCEGRSSVNVNWFGTVRGRLGYAFGNTLLYATGGFAAGGVKATSVYTDNDLVAPNGVTSGVPQVGVNSRSATNTGWTAGAGIEVKLSPSWSLKGEYQFINLGTISSGPSDLLIPTATSPLNAPCSAGSSGCLHLASTRDVDFHTVRAGLNYYFNTPPAPLK
jgi:outer membrane immunogenic protein